MAALASKGLFFLCSLLALPAVAAPPILIDKRTGTYLGELSSSTTDPDSISNTIGRYGAVTSPDSINNPVGRYGSLFGPDSATNPLSPNPPVIYDNGMELYD